MAQNHNGKINRKKKSKVVKNIKKSLKILGTTILSIVMIFVITGSILATSLTVYVLNFVDEASLISLDDIDLSYTTVLYAKDAKDEYVPIYSIAGSKKCVWVDIEDVPQHVQDAFVFAEDARFYSHDGVDFKRTFAAFANYFLDFYSSAQGGSTITQQLVKNITGDDEQKPDRKIREIFSAINMEKNYTKTDILEAYMNIAHFWYNMYGVQTAANFYFDKDVAELTPAEAASIVAITKSPRSNNPIAYPENNKVRREYILGEMYKYGSLSSEEYEEALNQELKFVGYNKVQDEAEEVQGEKVSNVSSYFVDAALNQAIDIFAKKYGIDNAAALQKIRSGGYHIYTTVDMDIQKSIEAKCKDPKTFSAYEQEDPVQAAFITMDYNGNVLGVVGGYGEKTQTLGYNRATEAVRSPGSTIKPIASYAPSIEYNLAHWSTMFKDEPLQIPDGLGGFKDFMVMSSSGEMTPWPQNYSRKFADGYLPLNYCLQVSLNTTAARLVEDLTPKGSYDFLKDRFKITTLKTSDIDRSPMSIGGLTDGLKLLELTAAYQAFGNAGSYYEPTFITKIVDSNGAVVYEHEYRRQQALSSDTAYVMNRLLKRVVDYGTGTNAKIGINGIEIVAKTGTSQDKKDLLFVGCTPEYVSGLWYGYDTPKEIPKSYYNSSMIWNNIFRDTVNSGTKKTFDPDPNVVAKKYCTETGLLAGPNCTKTETGYYKKDNIPNQCMIDHKKAEKDTETDEE